MHITQADLARASKFSPATVGRVLNIFGRLKGPLDDFAALVVLTVDELMDAGLNGVVAASLLREFSADLRHVANASENRAWILFIADPVRDFRRAAINLRHLEALINAHPLANVLALHDFVGRAGERLAKLRAEKEIA